MSDLYTYTDLSYAPFETEAPQALPPPKSDLPPPPKPQKAPQQAPPPPQQNYDISLFNQQFEQQRLSPQQQQPRYAPPPPQEPSYWDRLFSKKKELFKFLQSGLIILFAISLHFILDFALKNYLETHDVSKNREMWIRALYPIGVLFVAWNIIAFIPK